ncbi:hypothetical protein HU200_033449 [Digitaria exilis]|uniref:Leucine-rich repeat-containing N-terminal plant-type domain-containing protein n=1 Tax=Digitaria exilis TaxID=1010633 RepID=A0A835BJ85_9POAL|nr:hypothetical protein HU200_033449 [Digitaria exilis]
MKTSISMGVLVVSLLSSLLMDGASSRKDHCHADDRAALLSIDAALGNYFSARWTSDDRACCSWASVHCDPFSGRVTDLYFAQLPNFTGTIPDAIAGLTHLTVLEFDHLPGVSGAIPPAIAKLSNLSELIISWTSVSGPVPSFLGKLTQLTLLDLSFNSLSGEIPASIAALPYLNSIDISRNRLTGALPPLLFSRLSHSSSQQPAYLRLSHNNLSGSIPAEFAGVEFAQVDLSRNAFAGDASPLFGVAKQLQYLDLSRNAFSFNLSGVELPEQINGALLSHNAIYGGIPAQFGDVAHLYALNVSYNRLCGEVPSSLMPGQSSSSDVFCFQHNKCLCGAPLPPCNSLI